MAFWKRVASKTSGKTPPVPKSASCPKLQDRTDGQTNRGPLAGFQPVLSVEGADPQHPSWTALSKRSSRLSKTLQEFLAEPAALGYLIQYMEAREAAHLVKFYLDVQSFRCSASAKLTGDGPAAGQLDKGRLERVPENDSIDLRALDEASSGSRYVPSSPSSGGNLHSPTSFPDNSGSVDSFDSGFFKSEADSSKVECEFRLSLADVDITTAETDSITSSDTNPDHSSTLEVDSDREHQRAQSILKNRTEDAVKIYKKYISPESTTPIHIPTAMKKDIVELICDASGLVPATCFDNAQVEVLGSLDSEYFPGFLESEYHAKHQVDVLTGGTKVFVTDILFNDMALFHLMEFMESEGQRPVIEFWMAANNFNHSNHGAGLSTTDSQGAGETTHDAMILYDKFFSMQATSPLGFEDKIRLEIENNICQESGPALDCFARPMEIIVEYLEAKYLDKFLNSKLFQSYIKELISSIQLSTRNLASVGRTVSTESLSSCNSDSASRLSNSGSSRNTLLASGDKINTQLLPHQRFENMRIDYGMLTDPDSLWKRNPIKSKVGKVDYLGRYYSSWEQPPDLAKEKGLLGKAVRRLGRGEHAKLQEEMAWQVAESFVKDVTSITLDAENSPEAFKCSEEAAHEATNVNNNPCKGLMKKSISDNSGLQCV